MTRFVVCLKNIKRYGLRYYFWKIGEILHIFPPSKTAACKYKYFSSLSSSEREKELQDTFLRSVGYTLNLQDPHTFDEKIQWLKLYDSTPQKTRLADKYAVRSWIVSTIGEDYLIPILGVWEDFNEIDFDKLPDQFVLKANHGCNMNIIVKDKSKLNVRRAKRLFHTWMNTFFGIDETQEWHYLDIPHRILAEEYLEDSENKEIKDYKVFCFNGKPKFVQVVEDRHSSSRHIYMDTVWNKLPFTCTANDEMEDIPEKPFQLEEMLRLSEILSCGYTFVRIDWYLLGNDRIYFGEMTFTPLAGFITWKPKETDEYLGSLLELPVKQL